MMGARCRRRKGQYTPLLIADEEVFTSMSFFFTGVVGFLGQALLGAIRWPLAAIDKERLRGGKALEKPLDLMDLSFG